MRRMTLARIRLRKRLLPRFRHLAFESLYDRITLDASLPAFIADGHLLRDAETGDYLACVYRIADEALQEGESPEIVECDLLPGEQETESAEPIEWELLALEDYEETSEEQWIDGAEEWSEVDGELIDPIAWETGEGEVVDPVAWETGEGEEFVMYSFMTGVVEEDAGQGEVIADSGELEPLPDEESIKTSDDQISEEAPLEDYVVSAEGEYLPLAAVQRTLDAVDVPQAMAGDMSEIVETTVVEESSDGVLVEPVPESLAGGATEIFDFFEPTEAAEMPLTVVTTTALEPAETALPEVIESASVLEGTDAAEFILPEAGLLEVDSLDATDLQTYAPSIAATPVIEITSLDRGLSAAMVTVPTSVMALDPSTLQLAATSGLAQTSNPDSQDDESDESTSIKSSLPPATTVAETVTSEEDEEEETDDLPAEDEVAAQEDEEALADVEADAAAIAE